MRTVVRRSSASWLLAFAALCLVAQSTLWPLVAPSMAAWSPAHGHITTEASVPDHVHAYDGHGGASDEAACRATADDRLEDAAATDLVCTASNDGGTTSVTTALRGGAFEALSLGGATTSSALAAVARPAHLTPATLTPPPRS